MATRTRPELAETPDPAALAEATGPAPPAPTPEELAMHGPIQDGGTLIPAVDPQYLTREKNRQEVDYWTDEPPCTIIVDPYARYLYCVLRGDRAVRYAVAVGDQGRGFSGERIVLNARDWPRWTAAPTKLAEDSEI